MNGSTATRLTPPASPEPLCDECQTADCQPNREGVYDDCQCHNDHDYHEGLESDFLPE